MGGLLVLVDEEVEVVEVVVWVEVSVEVDEA